jgi:hypothetical protein
MSADWRTLLRTLGADRSKMTRCLRVGPAYYVLGSPQEIPMNAQDLVVLFVALSLSQMHLRLPRASGGRFLRESIETGNHIEKFLVNRTLTQPIKGSVQVAQQRIDVLLRALHGRETAGVFAG